MGYFYPCFVVVVVVVNHFLGLSILFSSVRLGELHIFVGRQGPFGAIKVGLGVVNKNRTESL